MKRKSYYSKDVFLLHIKNEYDNVEKESYEEEIFYDDYNVNFIISFKNNFLRHTCVTCE